MKRFLRGLVLGFLVAIPIGALAIIGGGIIAHTHSSASGGGSTLSPSSIVLSNATQGLHYNQTTASSIGSEFAQIEYDSTGTISQTIWGVAAAANCTSTIRCGFAGTRTNDPYEIRVNNAPAIVVKTDKSLASFKPCATNYTRIGPNFCQWNSTVAAATNITTACTSIASPASDAVALLLNLNVDVTSTNTLNAMDQTVIFFYGDTGCVTPNLFAIQYTVREWTATAATSIGSFKTTIIAPNVSGNARAKITAGVAGANSAAVIGYFD